jgi:hypothetical protein
MKTRQPETHAGSAGMGGDTGNGRSAAAQSADDGSSAVADPTISLPRGGDAIRGTGEISVQSHIRRR